MSAIPKSYSSWPSISGLIVGICFFHVLLQLWQAYVVQINNDGILYVNAARQFALGHWGEARSQYSWFAYPLMLGKAMALTGIDAWPIALLLNGFASTLTLLVLLRCAWVLMPAREVLIATALLLFGNLWFNDLRGAIVREHFYFLLMIAGVYCAIRDTQSPGIVYRIGFVVFLLLAGLFRVEALGFLVLVGALRVAFECSSRSLRFAAVIALVLAPVAAFIVLAGWSDSGNLASLLSKPRARIAILRDDVLAPFESRKAALAYSAMVIGLLLYALVNSIGLVPMGLAGWVAVSGRAVAGVGMRRLVLIWVAAGAAIFGVQIYFNIVFDARHGLILSLVLTPVAAVGLVRLYQASRDKANLGARWLLGLVAALLVVGFVVGLRKYDAQNYRFAAGAWLKENMASGSKIASNSSQILFYGGYVNTTPEIVTGAGAENPNLAIFDGWKNYDAVVVEIRNSKLGFIDQLESKLGIKPTVTFQNGRGDRIVIFKTRV